MASTWKRRLNDARVWQVRPHTRPDSARRKYRKTRTPACALALDGRALSVAEGLRVSVDYGGGDLGSVATEGAGAPCGAVLSAIAWAGLLASLPRVRWGFQGSERQWFECTRVSGTWGRATVVADRG